MKILLHLLGWTAGLLLVAVLLAVVLVLFVVDPNDFKGMVARELGERLGRPVEVPGRVRLSLFPWLGLEVGRVTMGNPAGFKEPTFATIERADLRVKLLPLLHRQVETDTVLVHGLDVRLVRSRDGRTNWQDLPVAGAAAPAETSPAGPGGAPAATPAVLPLTLAVGGVSLREGRVSWTDEATGRRVLVEGVDLRTGTIAPGTPVPLTLTLKGSDTASGLRGQLEVKARVDTDPDRGQYRVRDLQVAVHAAGPGLPREGIDFTATGQLDADFSGQTVRTGPLQLVLAGVGAESSAVVEWPEGALRYSASIDTRETNLRPLLEALTGQPPRTADPKALSRVAFGARVAGNAGSATVSPVSLRVDDSTLEGQVEVTSFAGPAARFDLLLDRLDLNRYLPPGKGGAGEGAPAPGSGAPDGAASQAGTPAAAGDAPGETTPPAGAEVAAAPGPETGPKGRGPAAGEEPAGAAPTPTPTPTPVPVPVAVPAWILGADLQGRLRADEVRAGGARVTDLSVKVATEGGVLRLDPIEAHLFQGTHSGRAEIDLRRGPPRVHLDNRLSGVQMASLLEAMAGKATVSGRGDLTLRVQFDAADADTALGSLNGDGRFGLRDGAIQGFDIGRAIRQARARLEGQPVSESEGPAETDFSELHGTFRIAGGVARNDDLQAKSPLLRLEGRGTADLRRQAIDYFLTANIVGTGKGQGGRDLEDLRGIPIPLRVSGPLQNLTYRLELDDAVKAGAREQLRRKVEDAIDRKLGGEKGEKAKNLLRGFFN